MTMTMTMDVNHGVPIAVDATRNDISGLCVFKLSNPSAVYDSMYCRFFGPNKHTVVVSKGTRLEFFEIISTGLVARLALPLNGRVVILHAIPGNAANMSADHLFIVTEKERYCVLRWDETTSTVITVDSGDIHDRAYRPIEVGQLSVVDSQGKWLALHSVQGLIKILPVDARKKDAIKCKGSYNVRVSELQILDLQFTEQPVDSIVILHEGISGTKTLSCRTLDQRDKDLKLAWTFDELEPDAHMIIAVPQPRGGVVVIGDESILYYNHSTNDRCAISLAPIRFTCFCSIGDDGYRFVMGSSDGGLYLLLLLGDTPQRVNSIKLESMGTVSIPSTLTYLDNGYLYVGSKFGPSQIVQLTTSRLPDGSFLNLIDSFPSLAPIVDVCATDMEGTGHHSLVACSGAYKHGGVSTIRKGLTITPHVHIPLDSFGVCRTFAATIPEGVVILLSSVNETRILLVQSDNEAVSELSGIGFIRLNTPTLGFHKLGDSDVYVQVVGDGAYFGSLSLNNQYQSQSIVPPNGTIITKCAVYGHFLALVFSNGLIVCYQAGPGKCDEIFQCQSSGPVSALCLSYINIPCIFFASWESSSIQFCGSDGSQKSWVVDGTFAGSLIRDIAYHHQNLIVSTGEGTILRCPLSPDLSASGPWCCYVLGKSEVKLYQNGTSLIACSNRPYIIATGMNGELHTIPTNINHINCMQLLSSHEVIAITATDLLISRLPDMENMSGISFDVEVLGETVNRIAEVPRTKYLVALAATHASSPIMPRPTAKSRVVLLNKESMTSVHDYPLDGNEVAHSILVLDGLSETGEPLIVVGTAFIEQPGTEPSSGRLLTFSLPMESSLSLINQIKTSGCVYSLAPIGDKHLIATVNGKTELYMWKHISDSVSHRWTLCDTKYSQILGVKSDACRDLVAVGDLMKSVTLFKFIEASGNADALAKLESFAQSHETSWTTEVKIISPTKILAGDNLGNIFVLETKVDEHFSPARHRLDLESAFHLGEVVNKITAGNISTIQNLASAEAVERPSFLVATNTGSIYQLLSLCAESYALLAAIQRNMDRLAKHIGDFTVEGWRSFSNERRKPRHVKQFIDGDFVLSFLSLPTELQEAVLSGNGIKDGEAIKDANPVHIHTLLDNLSNETRN